MHTRPGNDQGFSMVEVLVATVIFGMVAAAVTGVVIGTMALARTNTQRSAAVNLAMKQIEAMHSMRALDIPDGATTLPAVTVAGTTYTIQQSANFVTANSATTACVGTGSTLAYKLVTVTVTWPRMGSVQPVRMDTLKSLGTGSNALDVTLGSVAVAVLGADGAPRGDVQVTLNPGGLVRTTGADGCAIFVGLAPGTYAATLDHAGYVGINGSQLVTAGSLGAVPGTVSRYKVYYDAPGYLSVALTAPAGYAIPAAMPLTLSSTTYAPLATLAYPDCGTAASGQGCVSGTPRLTTGLYPGSYAVWPGTCTAAAQVGTTLAAVTTGATTPTTAALGGVTVTLVTPLLRLPTSGTVYARQAADAGCGAGETYPLTVPVAGTKVALPAGLWTFSTTPDGSSPPLLGWPSRVVVANGTGSVQVET